MSITSRILTFLAIVVLSTILGYFAIRNYVMETFLSASATRENLQAITRLSTQNADVDTNIGRAYQYDVSDFDLHKAIQWYLVALRQNPYAAYVWIDLSRAYESLGQISQARDALQNATLAFPASTYIHWSFANFLVRELGTEVGGQRSGASEQEGTVPASQGAVPALSELSNNPSVARNPQSEKGAVPVFQTRLLLAELRKTVELSPSILSDALSLATRAGIAPDVVYQNVVPMDVPVQLAAISWFTGAKEWPTAALAWKNLSDSGQSYTMEQTLPYTNVLIDNRFVADAVSVWSKALKQTHYLEGYGNRPGLEEPWYMETGARDQGSGQEGTVPASQGAVPVRREPAREGAVPALSGPSPLTPGTSNLIFNPDFTREPLNGGFDWRVADSQLVPIRFDPQVYFKTHRSLRIDFTGASNVDFSGLAEYVPVLASTDYSFSAWVKSEDISTDQGPFFEIVEMQGSDVRGQGPANPQFGRNPKLEGPQLFKTVQVLGTSDWTELRASVPTGPETNLLLIHLRRVPSAKFDNLIKGKIWIGSVELTK